MDWCIALQCNLSITLVSLIAMPSLLHVIRINAFIVFILVVFPLKVFSFFLVFISVPSCLSININFCKSTKPIQFHVVIYFHYAINWWGRPNYKWRSPISVWMRQFWSIFFTSLFQWNYYLKGKPPSELPQGWLGWSTIQIRLIQTADIEFVFLLIRGN